MNMFFNNLFWEERRISRDDIKVADLVRIKRTKFRIITFKR